MNKSSSHNLFLDQELQGSSDSSKARSQPHGDHTRLGPGLMSDLCVTGSLFCKPRDPKSPHPTFPGRALFNAEVHGMTRIMKENAKRSASSALNAYSLPIIKVEQSTVVHQPVLSFDRCRGNLKSRASNFASLVTSF
jgi:hypothetical protein